jgi:integrase
MTAYSGTPNRQGTHPIGQGRPPGSAYGRATPNLRLTPAPLILIDALNHPDCRCAPGMAYYDKARGRWRANVSFGGARITHVLADETGKLFNKNDRASEKLAIIAEDKLKAAHEAEAAKAAKPGQPGIPKMLGEAVALYLDTRKEGSGNWRNRRDHLGRILRILPADTKLSAINGGRIAEVLAALRLEPIRVYIGGPRVAEDERWKPEYWRAHPDGRLLSEQSVHHHIVSLGAVLGHAVKLEAIPKKPEMAKASPPDRLPNPIRPEHLKRLLKVASPHVRDGIMIGAWLPARQREIWTMTVQWVDLEANLVHLPAETAKNKQDIPIPIARPLRPVLERLVAEARAAGRQHLLVWQPPGKSAQPRPIKHPKTAWKATLRRAELDWTGYRLHDLKGHFTTELLRTGARIMTAMELSRHADVATTMRYVRKLGTNEARDAIDLLDMDAA